MGGGICRDEQFYEEEEANSIAGSKLVSLTEKNKARVGRKVFNFK